MSEWSVDFQPEAENDLARLDRPLRRRIIEKLAWLAEHFDAVAPTFLTSDLRAFYKLRVGDWRVMYQVRWEASVIVVCYIDHRDKAYKKRK